METFAGAWPDFENTSMKSSTSEDGFALRNASQSQQSKRQNDEWDGFIRSLDGEHSTAVSDFDNLPDFTVANPAPAGALSSMAGLPFGAPLSAASSSGNSYAISPPYSATQPVHSWPTTSGPEPSFAPFRHAECWTGEPPHRVPFAGNFAQEGLCIQIPPPPQHFGFHHSFQTPQMVNQGSPHCSIDNLSNDGSWDRPDPILFPDDTNGNDDDDDEGDAADPCYAQLLWRCLKETPGHTMTLKDLYDWVASHSSKAKDPKNRGWQNSVRHNLSMNAAFERVSPSACQGAKKGSLWRLTESALREGVISTTRYRKDPKRKSERKGPAAFKRQQSGARGGQATRAATRRNRDMLNVRSTPYSAAVERRCLYQRSEHDGFVSPMSVHSPWSPPLDMLPATTPASPYFFGLDSEYPPQQLPFNPRTPPQLQLSHEGEAKPALHNFELRHIDLTSGGVFGNTDNPLPDTPSWSTEASWTDDGAQSLLPPDCGQEATI